MAPLTRSGATPGRPSPRISVREQPLALEPVTRDPFIDEPDRRGPDTPRERVFTAQSALVRASLLRLAEPEERK